MRASRQTTVATTYSTVGKTESECSRLSAAASEGAIGTELGSLIRRTSTVGSLPEQTNGALQVTLAHVGVKSHPSLNGFLKMHARLCTVQMRMSTSAEPITAEH